MSGTEIYNGAYFQVPKSLEPFPVLNAKAEILLELRSDWIDMRTAERWAAKE
jgi:hypothetical protein